MGTMKQKLIILAALNIGFCAAVAGGVEDSLKAAVESSTADAKVKAFASEKLIPLCTNPVFVAETKKLNAMNVSLDEIKKIDKEWMNAEEETDVMTDRQNNACAAEIKKVIAATPIIVEAFVMDNQGAVVGENNMTSDYWQGDEAKWKNSFNGGKGGVDVGKVKFDKSANTQLQQISLPIIDESGKVIGAVTYGLAVEKL